MKTARVTISRPCSSHGDTSIAITIEDDASSLCVVRLNMTLADFARCLTGHGAIPAQVERWIGAHAHRIGKRLEVREVKLSGRPPWKEAAARAWVLAHPDLILSDGWEIHSDGVDTQQHGDTHRIVLARYVEDTTHG